MIFYEGGRDNSILFLVFFNIFESRNILGYDSTRNIVGILTVLYEVLVMTGFLYRCQKKLTGNKEVDC